MNQAVSAIRCGAQVSMIGRLGRDQFGDVFIEIMEKEGIDHSHVTVDSTTSTSLGIPIIDPNRDNTIIGIPKTNTLVSPEDISAAKELITQHQILLLQLEIPFEASLEAVEIAQHSGMTMILNPAPAAYQLSTLLPREKSGDAIIDWFVPNEVEAEMLTGLPIKNWDDAIQCGKKILAQGVRKGVVITMGSNGVVAVMPNKQITIPSFCVDSVDPTGSGDAFCGAFAAALSEE